MAYATRRSYAGAAPACTLTNSITSADTSALLTGDVTNWNNTANGPFFMVIDPGLVTEEKILVGARTGSALSSLTRGVDGTTAASHSAGATCYPVFTATDADQANKVASTLTTKGDILSTDGSALNRLAVGTNAHVLTADSAATNGVKWALSPETDLVTTKGDILVASAADTLARQGVGSNGQVLVADSGVTNGVAWVDPQTNRNVVINGAMQVAQRGTSTASITVSDYYTADRWYLGVLTLGTWTQSLENDAPTGSGFRKSWKMLCTTADASPAAGDTCNVQYKIEGQNLQQFLKGTSSAKQFSLSFWVKSNVTGTYIAELFDADNTRHVSASYTVAVSGTWEKKTITFPADTTGAFDNDNASSLIATFHLAEGSDNTSGTLATTWASFTAANRAVGQTNLAAATNNYWQVTGVQLEVGAVATPFEFEDIGTTFAKCQRYYQSPSATPTTTMIYRPSTSGGFSSNAYDNYVFPVVMRTAPTLTFYAADATAGAVTLYVSTVAYNSATVAGIGSIASGWSGNFGSSAWGTSADSGMLTYGYKADAEL
jgi:hypothetical protein